MKSSLILASASQTRQNLLRKAGVQFSVVPARLDEELIKSSLQADGIGARDIADALADAKAKKVSGKMDGLVLGCDQVLTLNDHIYSKPKSQESLTAQLQQLRGKTHRLYTAAVLYEDGKPIWRHVNEVRMTMSAFSDEYLHSYVCRNWNKVQHAVGGYMVEDEGIQLFSSIDGDFMSVLGLPLLELLSYLKIHGTLPT